MDKQDKEMIQVLTNSIELLTNDYEKRLARCGNIAFIAIYVCILLIVAHVKRGG